MRSLWLLSAGLGVCVSVACTTAGDGDGSSTTTDDSTPSTGTDEASSSASGTSSADASSMTEGPNTTSTTVTTSTGVMQDATTESGSEDSSSEASTETADSGSAEPPSSDRMTARPLGTTDAGLGFWEYLPPTYDDGGSPLLVFFHGGMWTGSGSEEDLLRVLDVGPPELIAIDLWPNERTFVVLSPQYPGPGCANPDDIDAFLKYAIEAYDIDPQRVYLTAQSCGAMGSWAYLADHLDETVAAAVLIAGDGRTAFEAAGCELGRVPLWGFHNEDDPTIDAEGTRAPIMGLLECEPTPDVQLTIYPGVAEHDAWTKTYDLSAGHDVYGWMLDHVHP